MPQLASRQEKQKRKPHVCGERYYMDNYVMMQYFEWYMPGGGQLWNQLAKDVDHLKSMGVSGVWIPPCTKGTSVFDV